jgi:hypothetical protein
VPAKNVSMILLANSVGLAPAVLDQIIRMQEGTKHGQ